MRTKSGTSQRGNRTHHNVGAAASSEDAEFASFSLQQSPPLLSSWDERYREGYGEDNVDVDRCLDGMCPINEDGSSVAELVDDDDDELRHRLKNMGKSKWPLL